MSSTCESSADSTEGLTEGPQRTFQAVNGAHAEVKGNVTKVPGEKDELSTDRAGADLDFLNCCYPEKQPGLLLIRIAICFLAGIIFGLALEKGRVFEPQIIRDQMVFRRWVMMKMFLSALGTGQICLCLLSIVPYTKYYFQSAFLSFGGCFNGKGLLSSSVGPFILGIGMTLAGACPGMVFAQVGSLTRNSEYTLCGAFVGALFYGLLQPLLAPLLKPSSPLKQQTVNEKFNTSFARIGIIFGLSLLFVTVFLEAIVPWKDDLPEQRAATTHGTIFEWIAWPPIISGILIGLLQVPLVLSVKDTLGGSSSFQTISAQWVVTPFLKKTFSYLESYRCGVSNWWQVVYVLAAMLGSLISSVASGTVQSTKGVPVEFALSGGVLMLFGARFASGCTSGHGMSGAALLFWLSWLAVPCMFAGSISTALVLRAVGQLDVYDCSGIDTPCDF